MSNTLRVLAILFFALSTPSYAQYPTKPIRLLVPVAPGGGLDVVARFVAPKLSENLGKSVVVDNRTGASGAIALELTARAAPDGYTLMFFSAGQVGHSALNPGRKEVTEGTVVPSVRNPTSYNLLRDFTFVSQVAQAPYLLAVYPGLPAKTLGDFIAHAKANPGKLNYASSGHATLQHMVSELFGLTVGAKFVHIPYKGVAAAFPDLMSGRTHFTISSAASLSGQLRAGALRPLAVTSAQRMKTLPEVPTMVEAGIPSFVITQWHGVLSGAGTPRPVVERLYREIVKTVQHPDVAARLAADGTEPVGSSPQEFSAFVKSEYDKYSRVIQQTGIKPE